MSAIDQVERELVQAARVRWAAERVVQDLADRRQMDWVLRAKIRTLGQYLDEQGCGGVFTPTALSDVVKQNADELARHERDDARPVALTRAQRNALAAAHAADPTCDLRCVPMQIVIAYDRSPQGCGS